MKCAPVFGRRLVTLREGYAFQLLTLRLVCVRVRISKFIYDIVIVYFSKVRKKKHVMYVKAECAAVTAVARAETT